VHDPEPLDPDDASGIHEFFIKPVVIGNAKFAFSDRHVWCMEVKEKEVAYSFLPSVL